MATVPLASLAMPGVVVRRGEFGLGGFAEHDMAAGSCIASLPFDAILCEDVVWTPPLHPFALAVVDVVRSSRATAPVAARVSSGDAVSRVVDGVPLTTTDCRFALYCFMCLSRCGDGGASDVDAADCTAVRSACDGWGRGISNRWTAYLRCIPTTHHLPVAWTAAQRAWLQGTNLFGASEQRLAELQQWHSALLARVGAEAYAAALTWRNFLWAHCAFASRSFPAVVAYPSDAPLPLPVPPAVQSGCLLPKLDTFNHRTGTAITWLRGTTAEGLQFIAGADVAAGLEIFNNYGPKSNEEFIMSYGFAIPGNEQDYVTVSVSLRGDDPHASLRRLVLRAAGLRHPHTAHMCMDSGTALATAAAAPTPTPTPQHGNGARALLSAVDRAVSLCRRSGDVDDESFKAVAFHLRGDCEPLELFAAVCVGVMPASKLRMLLDAWLRDGGGSDGPSARVGDSDADMGGVAGEGACFRHMILHSDALINTRVRACDALHGLLSGKAAAVQAAADRLDAEVAPAPADVDADADGDDAVAAVRLNLSKLYVSSQLYILNAVLRTVVSMRQTFTSSQRRRAVDRYPGASAAVSLDDVMPGGALQLVCGASGAAVVTSRDLEPGAVASTSHAGDVLCPSTLSMVCPRLALALDTVSDLSDTHVVALGVLYLCRALDDVTAEDTESGDRPSSAWTTLAAWLRGCDVTVGVDASRQRSKRRRGGGSDDVSSAGHRWPSCGLPMPRDGETHWTPPRGSASSDVVASWREADRATFDEVVAPLCDESPELFGDGWMSLERFQWAMHVVRCLAISLQVHSPGDGGGDDDGDDGDGGDTGGGGDDDVMVSEELAILPLCCRPRHSDRGSNCTVVLDCMSGDVSVVALCALTAGDELCMSLGVDVDGVEVALRSVVCGAPVASVASDGGSDGASVCVDVASALASVPAVDAAAALRSLLDAVCVRGRGSGSEQLWLCIRHTAAAMPGGALAAILHAVAAGCGASDARSRREAAWAVLARCMVQLPLVTAPLADVVAVDGSVAAGSRAPDDTAPAALVAHHSACVSLLAAVTADALHSVT